MSILLANLVVISQLLYIGIIRHTIMMGCKKTKEQRFVTFYKKYMR